MASDSVVARYYHLTKPGIIRGNVMTAAAGFLLASKSHIAVSTLLLTLLGVAFVIGSGCVFNNYIDRGIDKKMARTKQRALVRGVVSPAQALIFGSVLGASGIVILALSTNMLTVIIGLVAFFDYVVLYGITKRKSVQGTLVGSVCGAASIVAGYTAVTNKFDIGALLLFFIMVFWQMPHFYAIAMYRKDDYAAANIPVLPLVRGLEVTKRYILFYIVAFIGAAIALTLVGVTGYVYLFGIGALGFFWLLLGFRGFKTSDSTLWAKKMFGFSLVTLTFFSVFISLNMFLP